MICEFRDRKMTKYMVLLVVLALCCAVSTATSSCEQKITVSYLDTAADMISKVKYNIQAGIKSGDSITREALDCSDLLQMGFNKSGVYTIHPVNRVTDDKPLDVYCDMETKGGGWTLIQRRGRFERSAYRDYFFKDWKSYKEGFGDIERDFWLGNDNIFSLSNQKVYSVRFDLKDVENNVRYAQYDSFWIDDENHQYTLHITDYSGDAGDSMEYHNNQKFSTKDRDNDNCKDQSCAKLYKGGWWYNGGHHANLNGLYIRGKHESVADGLNWYKWKGLNESMESTEIKIRPKKFKLPHLTLNTPE